MSGVFKKIKKVFKKVVKIVKKVAPIALVAAAAIFTGGAALGVLPSFGSAVGGLVSSLGISGTLGGVLTGAVTNAGLGGLVGGVLGGKKGMMSGIISGGLLGGAMGAAGQFTSGAAENSFRFGNAGKAISDGVTSTVNQLSSNIPAQINQGLGVPGAVINPATLPTATGGIAGAAGAAGGGGSVFSGLLSNPMMAGSIISGIGQGAAQKAADKAAAQRAQAERDNIAANYNVSGGLLDPTVLAGNAQSYDPGQYDPNRRRRWVYDQRLGQMVQVQ